MRSTRLGQFLVVATLIAAFPRPSVAEFFETTTRDIEILITCLIREFQAGGDWKACIDPDLARASMSLVITDPPGVDFSYVNTEPEHFDVVQSVDGIAGIPRADGKGASNIETLFVDQGVPRRGAIIAHAFFRTAEPLPPRITELPVELITVTEEYKILLDDYATAVRDFSNLRDGTRRSPVALYRFNVGIDDVVRNVGTGGVGFDGVFELGVLDEGGFLVPGPDLTDDGDLTGFEFGNRALNVGLANATVSVPHPAVDPFDPLSLRNLTLSGWVHPRGSEVRKTIALFPDAAGNRFIAVNGEPGAIQFTLFDENAGADGAVAVADIPPDQWSHFAAVLDDESDLLQLYINGRPAGRPTPLTAFGLQDFELNVSSFSIGGQGAGVPGYLLDEIALWDVPLTDDAILRHYDAAFTTTLPGDYNLNGTLDANDLDLQSVVMKEVNPNLAVFDENGDGVVDLDDRLIWIHDYRNTWVGDADLNGEFNSNDLIFVFRAAKYERAANAIWEEGDWDGDMFFRSGDLILAFIDAGYEQGPRPAANAVPEPSAGGLAWIAAVVLTMRRRSTRRFSASGTGSACRRMPTTGCAHRSTRHGSPPMPDGDVAAKCPGNRPALRPLRIWPTRVRTIDRR